MGVASVVVGVGVILGVVSMCFSRRVEELQSKISQLEAHMEALCETHRETRAADKAKLEKIQEVLDE